MNTRTFAVTGIATAVVVAGAAGCGSSKPAYCTDKSNLQSAVSDLGNVDLSSGGLKSLNSALDKVVGDAKSLVSSAKSDFPSETSAINTSVTSLKMAVDQLPSSPSAQQLAGLGLSVKSVVTASSSFVDATKSKCS